VVVDHLRLNQIRLSKKIIIQKLDRAVNNIAGVDVAIRDKYLVGCIGVFKYPGLQLIEHVEAVAACNMPYIPGFLSYREIPVLLKCYKKLRNEPDIILVDGQGIAHPRSLGLASHLGLLLQKPTIGCAKSRLCGDFTDPVQEKGSSKPLIMDNKIIGLVLRTRDNTKPLFISPGHLVDISDCRHYVLSVSGKYRIPEPIRFAHMTAGAKARGMSV
jgi:deoxyribonuclease V